MTKITVKDKKEKKMLEAITKWCEFVDKMEGSEDAKKFAKGHPFFFKESEQFFKDI